MQGLAGRMGQSEGNVGKEQAATGQAQGLPLAAFVEAKDGGRWGQAWSCEGGRGPGGRVGGDGSRRGFE